MCVTCSRCAPTVPFTMVRGTTGSKFVWKMCIFWPVDCRLQGLGLNRWCVPKCLAWTILQRFFVCLNYFKFYIELLSLLKILCNPSHSAFLHKSPLASFDFLRLCRNLCLRMSGRIGRGAEWSRHDRTAVEWWLRLQQKLPLGTKWGWKCGF